jgi:uncharacterized small protein (DUF1192 family)
MARKLPYNVAEFNRRIALGQTETHARRMARGYARHQSIAHSRGHHEPKGQEHKVRAERAIAAGRLTERERTFARRQGRKAGMSAGEAISRFGKIERYKRENIMSVQHALRARYRSEGSGDYYEGMMDDYGLDADDYEIWIYYGSD